MKNYKFIFIPIFAFFYTCAVISPPSGGEISNEGAQVVKITPLKNITDSNESIEIIFDKMLDPTYVYSSFTVYPYTEIIIKCFRNKIQIRP